jgi:hypothetical protein
VSLCSVGGCGSFNLFVTFHQTLLHQLKRDDNVRTLLQAIRDAFDIAKMADILRNMDPESTQAKILDEMLSCVSECAKFIISYAEDVQLGMSSFPFSLVIEDKHLIQESGL